MQDMLNGQGTMETLTAGTSQRAMDNSKLLTSLQGKLSTVEAELEVVRSTVETTLKRELEALASSIQDNWLHINSVQEEVKKPPQLPMQLFQQLHDRLTLQERKQKEQDEQVRKILDKLSVQAYPLATMPQQSNEEEMEDAQALLTLLRNKKKTGNVNFMKDNFSELSSPRMSPRTERGQQATPLTAATLGAPLENFEIDVDELKDEAPRAEVSFNLSEAVSPTAIDSRKSPEIVRKTKSSVEREERFRAGGAHQRARAAAVQPKALKQAGSAASLRSLSSPHAKSPQSPHSVSQAVTNAKKQLTEQLQPPEEVEWTGSIWELSLFIGAPGTTAAASVHMFLLLLANVFAQLSFALIAFYDFTDPAFGTETLEQVVSFREAVGHDVKYQDTITRSSLMSQICNGAGANLPFGTVQSELLEQIEIYLGRGESAFQAIFGGGLLMVMLALCSWGLVYVIELERATTWSMAVTKVKRLRITSLVFNSAGEIEVEGFSGSRFVLLAVLLLVRYLISSGLLVCGCLWLAYTVDVQDLLLNAVALGFVLELDEMLFALAPMQFKSLVAKLKPLPAHSWPSFLGCDMLAIAYTIFVPAVAVIFYFTIVGPQIVDMRTVEGAFCDGELDFVYAEDSLGLTYVSPASPLDRSEPRARIIINAVEEAITGVSAWTTSAFGYAFVADEFVGGEKPAWEVSAREVAELVDMFNPLCEEGAWNTYPQLKLTYARMSGILNDSWTDITCANQQHRFREDSYHGLFLRMTCPISSGCTGALSPLFSLHASQGCPSRCFGVVQEQVAQSPCEDKDVRGQHYWESWAHYVGELSTSYERDGAAVAAHLMQQGCQALSSIQNLTYPAFTKLGLCTGSEWDVHAFAYACPRACGCASDGAHFGLIEQCPMACIEEAEAAERENLEEQEGEV